jgi:hypothetical protein
MLVFKSKLSVTITQPEFPEFITKFDPTVKLPQLGSLHGFYKPASQELTIIRNQEEVIKTIIADGQIDVTVPFTSNVKEQIKEYIEHVFFNDGRLFKWFAENDMDENTHLSIATRLMIDQYCRTDVAATIKPAFEKLEQGITHTTKTSRIIRDDDEFIIITNGYFLQMTMQKDDSFTFFNVTRQHTFEPTLKTYRECYEIGQRLDAYYLLKRI